MKTIFRCITGLYAIGMTAIHCAYGLPYSESEIESVIADAIGPASCHFEPEFHIQDDLLGEISMSLRGQDLDKCIDSQRSGKWLTLMNIIYPPIRAGLTQDPEYRWRSLPGVELLKYLSQALQRSNFSLVCETKIDSGTGWGDSSLGYLTIVVVDYIDWSGRIPIRYANGNRVTQSVAINFTHFNKKLPDGDGYMTSNWNLTIGDVYILRTNYEQTYKSHVFELEAKLRKDYEDSINRFKLGDISKEEAAALIIANAHEEAEKFAKKVKNGVFEAEYQAKMGRAKAEKETEERIRETAAKRKLEERAEKALWCKHVDMKIFVSRTLAGKGFSVSIVGRNNAEKWNAIHKAWNEKNLQKICEILVEADERERHKGNKPEYFIDRAGYNLGNFHPKFKVRLPEGSRGPKLTMVYLVRDPNKEAFGCSGIGKADDGYCFSHQPTYADIAILDMESIQYNAKYHSLWKYKKDLDVLRSLKEEMSKADYPKEAQRVRDKNIADFIKEFRLVPVELSPPK